ncbi:hypothetical protein ACF3MZ_24065 [Paenibacillaceae bacterium WGS1546]|uniref:hypothetical protein n=1 Tax=Cohnella sp. WGS1546 TaxID=3366810 RepID=UPI00372D3DC7
MHLPKNNIWNKQLKILLTFMLTAGSFSSVLAPRTAAAAGDSAAPGGVESNLVLWMKADDATADENGKLTSWDDQSKEQIKFKLEVNSNSVIKERTTPKINNSGANFNPSVTFNNS